VKVQKLEYWGIMANDKAYNSVLIWPLPRAHVRCRCFFSPQWSHSVTHARLDSSGRGIGPSQRRLPDNTHHSQQTRAPCLLRYSNPQCQQSGDNWVVFKARGLIWCVWIGQATLGTCCSNLRTISAFEWRQEQRKETHLAMPGLSTQRILTCGQ
jgi:hypothetical protein